MLLKLKLARMGSRTDEDCNAEIFSITDWKTCFEHYRNHHHKDQHEEDDVVSIISMNLRNTVTVTSKGAVIIRYSWKSPMDWSEEMSRRILLASRVVCWIVKNIS